MGRRPKEQEIDWSGAALETPKRGRGRPLGSAKKAKPATTPNSLQKTATKPQRPLESPDPPQNPFIDNNSILSNNIIIEELIKIDFDNLLKELDAISSAEQFTLRELKFLQIFFTGQYKQIDAMKLAGYEGYNDSYLYWLSKRIIEKHESREGDHRKLMRALGWGEVKIILSLIEAATSFRSETVRLNARIALAKMAGMQKEYLEAVGGFKLLVLCGQGAQAPAQQVVDGEVLPSPGQKQLPPPGPRRPPKPRAITK